MSLAYDTILTDRNDPQQGVLYTSSAAADSLVYPTSDTYNVMGPIYLPKVYGKDLTSFEIASSGKIAVTLQDIYSFDLDRTADTVLFQTKNDDKLQLTSGSNASIVIDGPDALVSISASNQVLMNAGDKSYFALDNSNIVASACNGVTATAGEDFNIWGKKVYINGKLVSGGSNDAMFFGGCNAFIRILDSNMDLYTQNQVHYMMSNHTIYDNAHDFSLTTETLALTSSSNVAFVVGDAFSTSVTAKYSVVAGGDMELSSSQAYSLAATDSITVSTLGLMTETCYGFVGTVLADSVSTIAASNIQSAANTQISSSANSSFLSTGQTSVVSQMGVNVNAVKDFSASASNVLISASNSVSVVAGLSNLLSAKNTSINSVEDLDISTSRQTFINTELGTTITDGAFVEINAPNVSEYGAILLQEYSASTQTNAPAVGIASTSFTVASDTTAITNTASALIQGSSLVTVQNNANTSLIMSPHQLKVHMDSLDVLVVGPSNVTINGELRINGDITSITTYQETLQIFDKQITLSGGASNGVFVDGSMTNSGSGMIISGFPSTDGTTMLTDTVASGPFADTCLYEKSIRLFTPQQDSLLHLNNIPGEDSLTAFAQESYWEVKGGDLRQTLLKNDGGDFTTFAWRINQYSELELIKSWSTGGVTGAKIVSKFGRVQGATGIVL